MRIVVSGTHASGKSTLIADLRAALPEYLVLGDPFDDIDDDAPTGERSFAAQLAVTAARLRETAHEPSVVSERGPLDFVAYLTALESLGRSDGSLLARATEIAAASLREIDLVVVLPLDRRHPILVPDDEDPELRDAMDDALLEIVDDLERDGALPALLVVSGDPQERLAHVLEAVSAPRAQE